MDRSITFPLVHARWVIMPGWCINESITTNARLLNQGTSVACTHYVRYYHTLQGLLIVDIILLVSGILSAIPVSADDSKIPGYPWLLICRFGVGFGAGGTAQS